MVLRTQNKKKFSGLSQFSSLISTWQNLTKGSFTPHQKKAFSPKNLQIYCRASKIVITYLYILVYFKICQNGTFEPLYGIKIFGANCFLGHWIPNKLQCDYTNTFWFVTIALTKDWSTEKNKTAYFEPKKYSLIQNLHFSHLYVNQLFQYGH